MEDHNEELNVAPELYFLIAKFLSGGPLKETAKTLLKELDSVEVLPRRLDWEGNEHPQAYRELDSQYSDVSSKRLLAVCEQALRLAQSRAVDPDINNEQQQTERQKLSARLSLLSESLVRNKPKYASFKEDHTLVRKLLARELGGSYGGAGNGSALATAPKPFPRRILKGLQLQRRTLGHLSAVYCLVFDCTGRYAVTGADDLLVKVWSAMDGRPLATLRGAGAEITDVCASSDGALLACGSVERLVRVWCLKTGAPKAVLSAHAGTITSVHWSPLGGGLHVRLLASTSTDGSVAFWTCAADGQFLSQPVQYVERMRPGACHMICAAWSAGGAFLAAGSADQHVRVYAAGVGGAGGPKRVLEAAVHTDAVDSLAWARRGLRFVSGSKDGTAALWQLHATQWRHTLLKATTEDTSKKLKVTMVCWDCSDEYIMTAVSDHTVRVWSSRTATQLRSLSGHKDEAYVLEAHPILPGVLLSAGHDGLLLVWDALTGEELARFHNLIEGQGEGAIFDAKWGGAGHLAAADSHGHLLLLGLGAGHPLLSRLPTELFFHTDYRPLIRDALGGALDEQTELPPHLMPPPFLVDVEGAPHDPEYQRLVPGRENLALDQLMPAARSRLDAMIEALANEPATPPAHGGGVWRGEGVRHTAGAWQALDLPLSTRPVVPQLPQSVRDHIEKAAAELHELELSWYRREMRRRPVMISTAGANDPARRRPGRRPRPTHAARAPREARPAPRQMAPRVEEEIVEAEESGSSDTSDESVRLSGSQSSRSTHSERYTRSTRSQRSSVYVSDYDSDSSSSASGGKQSASSAYSDWEAGAALQPPARARRRPAPRNRYSPSAVNAKRAGAAGPAAGTSSTAGPAAGTSGTAGPAAGTSGTTGPAVAELPEMYRVGEWLTAVSPRKAPYHPQMGDHLLYFRLGHQRYFEAVAEKDVYKVNPRDKPWERDHIRECEQVQVIGMKYVIKPPRVVCLKLSRAGGRALSVRYHDMPDVIDFLVLRHHYDAAVRRRWGPGDRFRCMIDDSWWTGEVLERLSSAPGASAAPPEPAGPQDEWAAEAASHFLSLRVRWDNGEVERLSPWDLEPLDPERLPSEPGGAVPVLRHELEAVVGAVHDWPPRACATIANHISQVMTLSAAEPFVAPVDLQLYPAYALVVPYPVDLATIRARFENKFYRRAAAAQFDARYLASNAEQFNESHSPIVRQARLVTDLLLYIISNWEDVDVVAKYHELAASYHSSDDEVLATKKRTKEKRRSRVGRPKGRRKEETNGEEEEGAWREACASLLRELCASADAEPFRAPVSPAQAPDYLAVVSRPMDLGTVSTRLAAGEYASAEDFAADVRLVFANSRLYNTNKRSRIYSMTVRLSSLFEALWALVPATGVRQTRHGRHVRRPSRHASVTRVRLTNGVRERRARTRRANMQEMNGYAYERAESAANGSCSSESEPLAETSRRVHAERADSSDSDAPLRPTAKGKGIGKKSKSGPSGASSSTSRVPPIPDYTETNGAASQSDDHDSDDHDSDNSIYTRIEIVEEELADDEVQLEYDPPANTRKRKRKKRRRLSSGSYTQSNRKQRKLHPKRTREPCESGSWSSSSSSWWSGSEPAGRYESDRSFHPQRVSTDDDAPLTLYRQRQEDEPGPSRPLRTYSKRGGVSLRSRLSPRRYNEDSEEDSAAAISKRLPHAQRRLQQRLQQQRLARAPHTDHDYFNGHAHAGTDGSGSGASGQAPVSISSRGRVRKLTAKARGLLRD